MWKDRKVPVLTIELKGPDLLESMAFLDNLQDISGLAAIRAKRKLARIEKGKKVSPEKKNN